MSDSVVETNIPVRRMPFAAGTIPPNVPFMLGDNVGSINRPVYISNRKIEPITQFSTIQPLSIFNKTPDANDNPTTYSSDTILASVGDTTNGYVKLEYKAGSSGTFRFTISKSFAANTLDSRVACYPTNLLIDFCSKLTAGRLEMRFWNRLTSPQSYIILARSQQYPINISGFQMSIPLCNLGNDRSDIYMIDIQNVNNIYQCNLTLALSAL